MFFSGRQLPGRMSTFWPGDDRVADLQADRLQDVALLAVGVGQQRDARRAVRVVLDRRDLRRDVALVALEVDDAVDPLVAAAAPPRRELAAGCCGRPSCAAARSAACTARSSVISSNVCDGLEPLPGRRRVVFANRHGRSYAPSQEFRHLLAFAQLHVRLLPVRAPAGEPALALDLAVRDAGADARDLRRRAAARRRA